MRWLLNNDEFRMTEVAANEIVKSGSLEVWEFRNMSSGMMQMAHPMHVHGGQFQVLERLPAGGFEAGRQTMSAGFTDEGWKDVVLVWPGERVRLLLKFGPFKGLFLYHCHNLEHEDLGLMRNFRLI
jgi:FtsP/CotA-like multicopper oxidase with cupredoxin domain